jgi:5-methyltetrahydropteroyltriglutamate--homocysteine methyltransferase
MKMRFTAQLGGIYPRSEQLIELTRSYDRGKTDRTSLEEQVERDTRDLVRLEEDSDFESFSDGAFEWQDQLRPVVESLEGVTTGTRYSRWFDTNTFYKKPTIKGKITVSQFDLKKFIRTDLLPKSKTWKVTLVGPYSFSELAENVHYKSRLDLVSDIAHAEHVIIQRLTTAGVSQFQISEPCLVYRPYREEALTSDERESALTALRDTVEGADAPVSVQTYFGDATRILPDLLKLPVDSVGFDLFETDWSQLKIKTGKKLALGIVDSRESNVEDPRWIAETATRVSKHIVSDDIILVPNSDLKFVPRKVADAKARSLADATRLVGEEN